MSPLSACAFSTNGSAASAAETLGQSASTLTITTAVRLSPSACRSTVAANPVITPCSSRAFSLVCAEVREM